MNLLLLTEDDLLQPNQALVTGRRARHLRTVLKARPGDRLEAGLLGGLLGTATVLAAAEDSFELELGMDPDRDRPPPPPLPVLLILALPRPKVLRRTLKDLAAMGAKEIVLVNASRVEKSYWQSPFLEEEELRRQLMLGLEQGKDTVLPRVLLRRRFKPFVEDELPALAAGRRCLVAEPTGSKPCPQGISGPMALAVGPEGGWLPYEVEKLAEAGFEAVSLGPRPLRVEAVVPFLLGRCVKELGSAGRAPAAPPPAD